MSRKVAVGIKIAPDPRTDPHERSLAHAAPTSGSDAQSIEWIWMFDASWR